MKIADLISPLDYDGPDQVVRFVWYDPPTAAAFPGDIVTVLTKTDRKFLARPKARERWRILRKAGWTITDVAPFLGADELSPAGLASMYNPTRITSLKQPTSE